MEMNWCRNGKLILLVLINKTPKKGEEMKLTWGVGVIGMFVAFVLFMLGLVYLATQQSHELVTENYYEEELSFIERKKREHRSKSLSEEVKWRIVDNTVHVDFPDEVGNAVSGVLKFYKPSAQRHDRTVPFESDSNVYIVDVSKFASGMYKLMIDWESGGVEYYKEGVINLR